ncbi:hypothetical protein Patl1_35890 [Pistacia atlantica]|nr:hypothetical protein Patl1_35890 [Pistacia atlantica]
MQRLNATVLATKRRAQARSYLSRYLLGSCIARKVTSLSRNFASETKSKPDVYSPNKKISHLIRTNRLSEARVMFDKTVQRNTVTWNAMIDGYNGDVARAMEFFEKMPERDSASLSALVAGLIKNGELDEAGKILVKFGNRRDGREDLLHAYNTLIAGYGQRGRVDEARRLFDRIPVCSEQGEEGNENFRRNFVSWNSMIMCYVKAGDIVSAREIFDQMVERDSFS